MYKIGEYMTKRRIRTGILVNINNMNKRRTSTSAGLVPASSPETSTTFDPAALAPLMLNDPKLPPFFDAFPLGCPTARRNAAAAPLTFTFGPEVEARSAVVEGMSERRIRDTRSFPGPA